MQVHKFNGTPVRNLRHLAEMVLACTEPHMRFDVDYSVSDGWMGCTAAVYSSCIQQPSQMGAVAVREFNCPRQLPHHIPRVP